MDSTFCIDCGHPESNHSAGGWTGTRCLQYPGTCDCIHFVPMPDPYECIDMKMDAQDGFPCFPESES